MELEKQNTILRVFRESFVKPCMVSIRVDHFDGVRWPSHEELFQFLLQVFIEGDAYFDDDLCLLLRSTHL